MHIDNVRCLKASYSFYLRVPFARDGIRPMLQQF